jgi:uncharacterized membrane protein YgcG
VGILNDEDFLYFVLASGDPRTQVQVLALGFTLWFDPEGGKKKRLGINFPLGAREMGAMPRGGRPDPQELYELHESMDPELRILREEVDAGKVSPVALRGVEIALGRINGTLVYELKVPLRDLGQHDLAIGVEPGAVIGIGMETPEIDREKMREEMMGRMGGGRGGGMEGGGGRMGGGRTGAGGGRPQPPEPIRVWAKVRTAEVQAGLNRAT